MYNVSREFLEALERGEKQHITGRIRVKEITDIELNDENLIGDVRYSRQCTANENEFAVGQLYTGKAEITIKDFAEKYGILQHSSREILKGANLYLQFFVDGSNEKIPLGKWTITEPKRAANNMISIVAVDCIGLLDVPINDNSVGAITLETRMQKVTELTGVKFAQTADEIKNLIGYEGVLFGSSFCKTCRAEVSAIAEFMGGIAYSDRQGKIAFRKFGTTPVLTIPADLRHDINLCEYTFGVRGIGFHDEYGHTTIREIEGEKINTEIIPVLSENPYIWDFFSENTEQVDSNYRRFLKYSANNLQLPDWTPGEVQYYGNPALDLGDFVEISGGINGENNSTLFLITAEHWQFRGAQTLISAGASENISMGNAEISKSQQLFANVNITKNIAVVDLELFENAVENEPKIIADCIFSAREKTIVFADITVNFRGAETSEILINTYLDNVKNPEFFIGKINKNEPFTVHFSHYFIAENGMHNFSVGTSGNAEILGFSAYIFGQNIVSELIIFSSIEELEKYPVSTLERFKIQQMEGGK